MKKHRLVPLGLLAALFLLPLFSSTAQTMQERWTEAGGLIQLGKYADALEILNGMLADTAIGKGRAVVLFRKGFVLSALNRNEESVEVTREYLELNPKDATGWGNLGWSLYLTGKVPEAIEVTQKAIGINASLSYLHFNMGLYMLANGKTADAMTHYDAGVKVVKAANETEGAMQDLVDLEKQKPDLKASIAEAKAKLEARAKELETQVK